MSDAAIALAALLVSASSLAASWLFRSPKEQSAELRADLRDLETRVATMEGVLNTLGREYAGIHGRHDQALSTLTLAINKLTDRFDAYMGTRHG
jgi:hypothetical protein